MSIREQLWGGRDSILEKWLDVILQSYPENSFKFFKNKNNRFDNPVGTTLKRELPVLLQGILDNVVEEVLRASLSEILHIRSVQDISVSKNLNFIFQLRKILRDTATNEIDLNNFEDEMLILMNRIDNLALLAFTIYTEIEEKIYNIRVNEVKREMSTLQKIVNKRN